MDEEKDMQESNTTMQSLVLDMQILTELHRYVYNFCEPRKQIW